MKELEYILLDICNTTINFQTADKFIEFVVSHKFPFKRINLNILKKFKNTIIGYFLFKRNKKSYKLEILKYLAGLSYEELDFLAKTFFYKYLKPNYNKNVIHFLKKYEKAKVIIVSGGFDIYIKYIAQDLHAVAYIASDLEFVNGYFTGRIKSLDCIGINKVIKLKEAGFLEQLNFSNTAVLSDSISDLPLFSLAKYKIAVNPDEELAKLIGNGWMDLNELLNN